MLVCARLIRSGTFPKVLWTPNLIQWANDIDPTFNRLTVNVQLKYTWHRQQFQCVKSYLGVVFTREPRSDVKSKRDQVVLVVKSKPKIGSAARG